MSLARQRVLTLCRRSTCASLPAIQTRLASSDSHSHQEDTTVYPEENFNTPFWRNTLLISLLGIGVYNLYPLLDKDGTYITRYIQLYRTPSDVWTRINEKHLEQSIEAAQGQLLITSAMRPRVHRMRNPLYVSTSLPLVLIHPGLDGNSSLDTASPHRVPVGGQVDMSNVQVKKDAPWGA
ncbi:hypothetical protein K439DRAFT_1008482 [Ramaria rubella]|nr:hypothetical protein K439DRAFT_1008482 [Ramaria rubella]